MNTASEVLVIVVSVVLAIFLLVLIVAGIYLVKVMRQLKRITARAQTVADSVEAAASAFERTASPLAVLRVIGSIVNQVNRTRKRKG